MTPVEGSVERPMRSYAAVFVSVFLAELGDKTQLATLMFATNPDVNRTGVFLAAAAALVISSGLAVLVGSQFGMAPSPPREDGGGARLYPDRAVGDLVALIPGATTRPVPYLLGGKGTGRQHNPYLR